MIGIVLLNYNQWDLTIDCINTIRSTCKLEYKIYLVDNNSTTKETDKFMKFYESSNDIVLLKQKINKGYSAGNNIGIKAAIDEECDYILISNNDVLYKDNCIENMVNFLDCNSEYGIVGPKVLTGDGKLQELNMCCKMSLIGIYKYILRKTPFRIVSKKFVNDFQKDASKLRCSFDVYAVSGCCFMMSKQASEILYPLDENTFLYEEENIIGVRMEQAGLKTLYNVDSEIVHLGGKSTDGLTAFGYTCFVESELYYCRKYLKAFCIQIIPLYIFRTCAFIAYYGFGDISLYFRKTIKMLNAKISKLS